ncbi:MAG: MbnP family protein [Cyclobacteriaceae bacterium]
MKKYFLGIGLIFFLCWLHACKDNVDLPVNNVKFEFVHQIDGNPMVANDMRYINAAGNEYEVTEVQYFISEVALIKNDGGKVPLNASHPFHYIDTNLNGTLSQQLSGSFKAGEYKGISYVFGIRGEKNKPLMFTDPPESNMIWPYHMGGDQGGYHYMKLNGYWMNLESKREPFNFHLGVGQLYDENNKVTEFVQNWFEVELLRPLTLIDGENTISIAMNIEQWFTNPYDYDHNIYGGHIMRGHEAMGKVSANGKNGVFEFYNPSIE